mgnify:CR=1 FL=1
MSFIEKLNQLVIDYGFKLAAFVFVLAIGWWLSNYAVRLVERALQKSKVDVTIHGFLKSTVSFFLKLIAVITAATILGVSVTTFIAMISAAGLAIGLALKDSLSNIAAGILLVVFKPFKVGDFIESGETQGTVLTIQLLYTALNTPDNRRVMVPNGDLATSRIVNYSVEDERRIDRVFSVAYGSDIEKVKEILMGVAAKNKHILHERGIIVRLASQSESALNFDFKVWVKREDNIEVSYDINEEAIYQLEQNHIQRPMMLREINLTVPQEREVI